MRFNNSSTLKKQFPNISKELNSIRQRSVSILCCIMLCSCGVTKLATGNLEYKPAFAGIVVSDEPQATITGKRVLAGGGNAADAAIATALTLSVTLPSRAGLACGGVCQIYDTKTGKAETLDFRPLAKTKNGTVAIPALPRALYALLAKKGKARWESLVSPAEQLAKFGSPVSRTFAVDIAEYEKSNGSKAILNHFHNIKEGDFLTQIELATVLSRLRAKGVGDFYSGKIAKQIVESAKTLNLPLTYDELKAFAPNWRSSNKISFGNDTAYFPHAYIAGGKASELWEKLSGNNNSDRTEALNLVEKPHADSEKYHSASTGFIIADASGMTVSCSLTMGEMFGNGTLLANTGMIPAVPLVAPSTEMALMLVANDFVNEMRFASVASGKFAVTDMTLVASQALLGKRPLAVATQTLKEKDSSGRVNSFNCTKGIPPYPETCNAEKDPRGSGMALIVGN
ncbi:MAG: gamma-glutamyltransferase [Alphaproteobacteria bacterium]|nr:gamma-glutamyltransferase [Alphaproteobacteria bacterium]